MSGKRLVALALAACATPAAAADDRLELWLAPNLSVALDSRTFVEVDLALRFRSKPAGDTYQNRLWLGRKLGGDVAAAGGIERTFEGARRETRILQQLSYPLGPLKARTRLEQRFVSDSDRTAWRVRQRIGHAIPLSASKSSWKLAASAEGFFTLRSGSSGGQTGLTGFRTVIGFERDWPKLKLTLGYVRNQAIRRTRRIRSAMRR